MESVGRLLTIPRVRLSATAPACESCAGTGWALRDDARSPCSCRGNPEDSTLGHWGVPGRAKRLGWDTLPDGATEAQTAAIRASVTALRSALEAGQSAIVLGRNGRGKTVMLAGAMRWAYREGRSCRYYDAAQLTDELYGSFGSDDETVAGIVGRLCGGASRTPPPSLLALDDIGAEGVEEKPGSGAWARSKLADILRRRYEHGLQVVAAANLRRAELETWAGPRLWDRLQDYAWIPIGEVVPSWRGRDVR